MTDEARPLDTNALKALCDDVSIPPLSISDRINAHLIDAVPTLLDTITTLTARLEAQQQRIAEHEAQESNFMAFGQGGAGYTDSQWLTKLYEAEAKAEQAEQGRDRLKHEIEFVVALGQPYGISLQPSWIERLQNVLAPLTPATQETQSDE